MLIPIAMFQAGLPCFYFWSTSSLGYAKRVSSCFCHVSCCWLMTRNLVIETMQTKLVKGILAASYCRAYCLATWASFPESRHFFLTLRKLCILNSIHLLIFDEATSGLRSSPWRCSISHWSN